MRVDLSRQYSMLQILTEDEKGGEDRLLPLAPEFGQWPLDTPVKKRTGPVFHWPRLRNRKGKDPNRVDDFWAIHQICEIGEKAKIVVNDRPLKYASAHDCRRAMNKEGNASSVDGNDEAQGHFNNYAIRRASKRQADKIRSMARARTIL